MLADIEWRPKVLVKRVLLAANAAPLADYSVVASADELIFSAQMLHSKQPVIISLKGACRGLATLSFLSASGAHRKILARGACTDVTQSRSLARPRSPSTARTWCCAQRFSKLSSFQ